MTETQTLDVPGGAATASIAGGSLLVATSENFSSKRQRRPSVRLGDIGDQHQNYDTSNIRKTNKQWSLITKQQQQQNAKDFNNLPSSGNSKALKSRPLTNLASSSGDPSDFNDTLDSPNELNLDKVAIGSWKANNSKAKRGLTTGLKRVRTNWGSNVDEIGENVRDFDPEGSQSPLNEQFPVLFDRGHVNDREVSFLDERREVRARVNEGRDHKDRVELSVPSGGTSGDRNNGNSGQHGCFEDGVKVWLKGLGLGRYAPVFEVHEVDDEVLPMLTLEDLKDMGINAVGPRRKMFCAIQKLGQEFS